MVKRPEINTRPKVNARPLTKHQNERIKSLYRFISETESEISLLRKSLTGVKDETGILEKIAHLEGIVISAKNHIEAIRS